MTRHGAEPLRSGTPEHAALEAELRDWMGRRADTVTPGTLRTRDVPLPAGPVRGRRVPLRLALPMAAVAAAAASWALLGSIGGSDAPRPVRVPPAVPAPPIGVSTPPSVSGSAPDHPSATPSAPEPPVDPPAAGIPRSDAPVRPPATGPSARRTVGADNPARNPPPATGEGRRAG
ncbi:hypothetical protein [Embleya sp. NPDC020886]|uniref:hypothetical protein n=1 Tax=Embleya sp. NPDC020886 TaxID=3363980 RepID=UPI0037B7E24B